MVKLQFLCVADNLLTSLPALLPAELEEVDASRNAIEVS
jgi:Leucine-rich repeat (LRR) protein